MCEPVTAGLIITGILAAGATAVSIEEGKKAEKRAAGRADVNRKRQDEKEANIRNAAKEANTAKDLQSASDSDLASKQRKARGKKALRSPVPVLGGLSSQPSLGGLGTPQAKPQTPTKAPTALGGI